MRQATRANVETVSLRNVKTPKRRNVETATRQHDVAMHPRLGAVPVPVILLLVFASITSVRGEMSRARRVEVFYQAQRAYEQGVQLAGNDAEQAEQLLREAANGFQALVDDGRVNGRLYYNLGNTYLRLNEVGLAILYCRKAERLMPDDGRLAEGLRFARSIRRNDIPVTGQAALVRALLFWHYRSSLRARAAVGIVVYMVFWLAAIGATFVRRAAWRYVLIVLLVGWVSLGVSVFASAYAAEHDRGGVIVADDVVANKDPGLGSTPAFEEKLHQGVEFELLDHDRSWYQIRLPNGKSGWIAQEVAELI